MVVRLLSMVMLLLAGAVFSGCYTVPETGRQGFSLISPSQEVQLGAAAFTDLKQSRTVSTDPQLTATVERVGRRIAKTVGDDLPGAEWEFVVFDDDNPNAFALPGGKVGVHTGLLKIAKNDHQLAVVVGHEIAHVTARHGAERMSQQLVIAGLGVGLDAALRDKPAETRNLALLAYGAGATVGATLPFSRRGESEADEIGLIYSAKSGYDPREAIVFWTAMKEASADANKPPEWLSTHPSDDTRIKRLHELMPKMLELYEKSEKQ
ncbi:M48 family metallopeptidase [Opitutales bacterium ASA1]|nr:M48 family metallopeptidase [Opitutales bacterium ASA1]